MLLKLLVGFLGEVIVQLEVGGSHSMPVLVLFLTLSKGSITIMVFYGRGSNQIRPREHCHQGKAKSHCGFILQVGK